MSHDFTWELRKCVLETRLLYEAMDVDAKKDMASTLTTQMGEDEVAYRGTLDMGLYMCASAQGLLQVLMQAQDVPPSLTEEVDYLYQTMIVNSLGEGDECQFTDLAMGDITWHTAYSGRHETISPYLVRAYLEKAPVCDRQSATWKFANLLCS